MKKTCLLLACLMMTLVKVDADISKRDIQTVVSKHNRVRQLVDATNMKKIQWDYQLQKLASKWAKKCYFAEGWDEDQNFSSFERPGQLLWTDDKKPILAAFFYWYDCPDNSGDCDSHNQIMYWNTTRVGCDKQLCMVPEQGSDELSVPGDQIYNIQTELQRFWVCFYGPRYEGGEVFREGADCTECEPGYNCNGGLCDRTNFYG